MPRQPFVLAALALILTFVGLDAQGPTKPLDPEMSIIGVAVKIRPPARMFAFDAARVYFVKLDDQADLLSANQFILSNYVKDDNVYLLNARPGRYVAVACFSRRSGSDYTAIFARDLTTATELTVAPGTVAFMGAYEVNASSGFKDADDVQSHFLQLIAPGAKTGMLRGAFGGDNYYRGSLHKAAREKPAEIAFLVNAQKHFKGSDWSAAIDKRLADAKAGT